MTIEKTMIEKISLDHPESKSADITEGNIQQLKQLFPDVFSEGKIDFEALKAVLGEAVDDRDERYNFTWNGKNQARQIAQTPSTGTLRPCKEKSINWDSTENLFIEGDNLEVLKLLQKSYHKKVKMIYIDPPYNTGKDFVYKDNFQNNIKNYLEITGQLDIDGKKLSTNSESSGRYHSDWLNMLYPRLKLARNLLKDDGVILISIDEVEMSNLKMICNEIFGEDNHIADFVWKNKKGGGNDSKYVAVEHEYVVMYAKSHVNLHALFEPYKPEYLTRYKEQDDEGKFFWDTFKRKSGKQYYPIECPDGSVLELDENNNKISWLRSEARFKSDLIKGDVRIVKINDSWTVHFKQRLPKGKKPRSVFLEDSILSECGTTSAGSAELLSLFKKDVFSNPKPVELISHFLSFNLGEDDIVLDFFAGSGTTGHSVFNLVSSGKKAKFVLVQLPEEITSTTEIGKNALSLGYKQISDVTRERLIKVNDGLNLNLGFKVFTLSDTNILQWDADFENLEPALRLAAKSIKEDRTSEDVLYEILLKYGLELTESVEETMVEGKKVFVVGDGALMVCLDDDITEAVVEGIAKLKQELDTEVTQVVFKDQGFADSVVKTNAIQILKQYDIDDVKSI
ncbi:site-specific DNA-methyltransferase [Vibrio cholerae]|uniref:site-specific DNA-methyltransferase n=1 Tax=Vibrio cholerae TaxID=666 RepID=UPI003967137D